MSDPDWLPPGYMSPSQVNSILTCGEQYRLERVVGVNGRPGWGAIGGSAVHRLTEDADRGLGVTVKDWDTYWTEALDEAKEHAPEWDPQDYYCSGRASKAWPNKEDPKWWAEHGPKFVDLWFQWRDNCGLTLAEFPDGVTGELILGIEVEVEALREVGDNVQRVRCIIDRVYEDDEGRLYLVDLKSGSHIPAWPRQLIINNLCMSATFGVRGTFAGYWKARDGGVPKWYDLDQYTDEWTWQQIWHAQIIRDNQLFTAQPGNLCSSACGVRQFCVAMGGTPHPNDQDATLTHNKEG